MGQTIIIIALLFFIPTAIIIGLTAGAQMQKQKVFKNCLRFNINPVTCLQYMKEIEHV